ncbi:sensor histidine kinase [Fodinicola acaciae]|uniref:sensor histidine kinase n=1 Tax=Fodinicola acaciae TaxID=2681555 RepID=UPI0013D1E89A|nr:sensor histidine kinase [Fodinicola acaciae]
MAAKGADAWRTLSLWHLVFVVVMVTSAGAVAFDGRTTGAQTLAALIVLASMCVLYVSLGIRALSTAYDQVSSLVVGYLVGMVALALILTGINLGGALVFLVVFSHLWMALPLRTAIVANVVAAAALGVVIAVRYRGPDHVSSGLLPAIAAAMVLLGILGGIWISRIIDQSRRRAELLAELRATRAQLAMVSHEAGVRAERERLARDIHDTLAQGFTGILLSLRTMKQEIADDPEAAEQRRATLETLARANLEEARALIAFLTPTLLDGASLADAVRQLSDQFSRELRIEVTARITGTPRVLAADREVVLLRAAQEGLANIRKHAEADRVEVELTYLDDEIILAIQDDGRGLAGAGHGFGLTNIRNRVAEIGGTVSVQSPGGKGTRLVVNAPLVAA